MGQPPVWRLNNSKTSVLFYSLLGKSTKIDASKLGLYVDSKGINGKTICGGQCFTLKVEDTCQLGALCRNAEELQISSTNHKPQMNAPSEGA